MPTMQIIFLFDLNAYTNESCKIGLDLNKQLLCLRLSCLRILNHYSTIEPNLKWGFKFFDSCGSLTQTMCKFSFPSFSLESYETLENEITLRYQRHLSYLDALSASVQRDCLTTSDIPAGKQEENNKNFYPIQVLQLALTQIVCEYHWSSQLALFSPSKKKRIDEHINKNDILFLVTKCPKNEEKFTEYFGTDINDLTFSKFSKILLSRSLHEKLLLKSSILWIWLNTNNEEFLGDCSSGITNKLAEMLKNMKCALIPLSILHNIPRALKYEENSSKTLRIDFFNSLIPFSSMISQSVSFPFYKDTDNNSEKAMFHINDKDILVHVIKMPLLKKSESLKLHGKNNTQNIIKKEISSSDSTLMPLNWSKFVVCFAFPKHCFPSTVNFLCLPDIASEEELSYQQFLNLNETLIAKNLSLVLECESACGIKMVGLFSPICDSSSLISVMSAQEFYTVVRSNFDCSIKLNCGTNVAKNQHEFSSYVTNSESNCLKPFQVECFEQWFGPSNFTRAIPVSPEQQKRHSSLKSFYKKLSLKLSKHQKSSPEKENIAPTDEMKENISENVPEVFDVSNLSEEELKALLTSEYELALNHGRSVLHSAKRIAKSAFSFFQLKSSGFPPVEEDFNNFMKDFFVTSQTLNEKYELIQEKEKIIQEYQLQVLIILETEILFPSSDSSNCIKKITTFLRIMSFYSGAELYNAFLYEILRENYKDTSYEILVKIGDELDIPIFEDEDESDIPILENKDDSSSPSESSSSNSMHGSNNSRISSVFSMQSSSSSSSRADSRKTIKQRSDIMDNSKHRKFLLTKPSPKKKYKNLCPGGENIPVRYSPRLSSKRKRDKNLKAKMNSGHVRRNLFPKDQKPMTPRYSRSPYGKKRTKTPKAHHVLKTNFVAETPTSKQNLSALERRKSFMDTDDSEASLTEIAESPKIVKNAKDTVHREHLKRLNSLDANQFLQPEPQPVPSCSSVSQCTPESKRRLSLKLFSKLLTSPTARMGLKKCSKRLFHQVSPQVENRASKRPKLDSELEKFASKNCRNMSDEDDDQKPSGTS